MRSPSRQQSALRSPLNDLLGTEANVRLLRVLSTSGEPLTRSRIATLCELDLSGVSRAIERLQELGVVEPIGAGTRRPVRFREEHPLAHAIRALFQSEHEIYPSLLRRLTQVAAGMSPVPISVWLEGSIVLGSDRLHDPVVLGVVTSSANVDATTTNISDAVAPIEREYDVTIEVRGRTRADLDALRPSERDVLHTAVPLLGPPPLALLGTERASRAKSEGKPKSHYELDRRARLIAQRTAERLRTDPTIVQHAQKVIARRLEHASPGERRELREWDRILRTMSLPRLRRFLVDERERATRLRQTSPFAALESAKEGIASHKKTGGK